MQIKSNRIIFVAFTDCPGGLAVTFCMPRPPGCIFRFVCNGNSLQINSIWIWPFRTPIPGKTTNPIYKPSERKNPKTETKPYQKHFDMPKTNWICAGAKSVTVVCVVLHPRRVHSSHGTRAVSGPGQDLSSYANRLKKLKIQNYFPCLWVVGIVVVFVGVVSLFLYASYIIICFMFACGFGDKKK